MSPRDVPAIDAAGNHRPSKAVLPNAEGVPELHAWGSRPGHCNRGKLLAMPTLKPEAVRSQSGGAPLRPVRVCGTSCEASETTRASVVKSSPRRENGPNGQHRLRGSIRPDLVSAGFVLARRCDCLGVQSAAPVKTGELAQRLLLPQALRKTSTRSLPHLSSSSALLARPAAPISAGNARDGAHRSRAHTCGV